MTCPRCGRPAHGGHCPPPPAPSPVRPPPRPADLEHEHCDYCGDPIAACGRRRTCAGAQARRLREWPTLGRVVHVWMSAGWRAAIVTQDGSSGLPTLAYALPAAPVDYGLGGPSGEGAQFGRHVALLAEYGGGESDPEPGVWRWPPRG